VNGTSAPNLAVDLSFVILPQILRRSTHLEIFFREELAVAKTRPVPLSPFFARHHNLVLFLPHPGYSNTAMQKVKYVEREGNEIGKREEVTKERDLGREREGREREGKREKERLPRFARALSLEASLSLTWGSGKESRLRERQIGPIHLQETVLSIYSQKRNKPGGFHGIESRK